MGTRNVSQMSKKREASGNSRIQYMEVLYLYHISGHNFSGDIPLHRPEKCGFHVDFMWISCGFRPSLGTSHDVAMTFFQLRSRDRDDRRGRDRRDRPSAVGSDEFIGDPSSEWSGTSTLWLPLVMTNSSPWYRWPIEIDGLPFLIAWRFSMAMLVITRWYPMNMITISPIHKYIMDHCGNHNQWWWL